MGVIRNIWPAFVQAQILFELRKSKKRLRLLPWRLSFYSLDSAPLQSPCLLLCPTTPSAGLSGKTYYVLSICTLFTEYALLAKVKLQDESKTLNSQQQKKKENPATFMPFCDSSSHCVSQLELYCSPFHIMRRRHHFWSRIDQLKRTISIWPLSLAFCKRVTGRITERHRSGCLCNVAIQFLVREQYVVEKYGRQMHYIPKYREGQTKLTSKGESAFQVDFI